MSLVDILKQYVDSKSPADPHAAHDHFDAVSDSAPRDVVGQGVADAFKSKNTPPFGEMVAQLFAHSDPNQRAGLLNQLLRSLGPGLLATLGGGALGHLTNASAGGTPQVTPEQASKMSSDQVQEIAKHAEQHDPNALDNVGDFYAQHPQLVKQLGGAALAIALAGVARRMRR